MNWGEIATWVYIGGIPLAVMPLARSLLRAFGDNEPSDLWFAAGLGVVTSLLWPFALVAAFVYKRLAAERHERDKRS